MRPSPFVLAAASLLALGGMPAATVPAPTTAPSQAQNKGVLPTPVVSKRAIRQAIQANMNLHAVGGRAPWVDRHGRMLRQVSRAMPRSIR